VLLAFFAVLACTLYGAVFFFNIGGCADKWAKGHIGLPGKSQQDTDAQARRFVRIHSGIFLVVGLFVLVGWAMQAI
jgi:hypothetical protein